MLPDPLHPAVVHFPIVLMFLLPLAALAALWAIGRGSPPRLAWVVPVALAGALALSAWVAVETGEGQEENAEATVGEVVLGAHEEAAERFLAFSAVVVLIAAAGLAGGTFGRAARIAGVGASLALIFAGYQVGHSGGRIVYGDGTAPGLVSLARVGGEGGDRAASEGNDGDDDD